MELDLEARLMGDTLILDRSQDLEVGDFLDLNDLNKPLELRRNQEVDDLGLTIEKGEVINEPMIDIFKTRHDDEIIEGIDEYTSLCTMKDKVEYKGKNVVGAFIIVPIFVGNFFVVMDFAVARNMNVYRDKDMGEVIVGKLFYREVCAKARRFDGFITIGDGNESVTYQIARSHTRFKHLTNKQCNEIRPLLKVSTQDEMNGISHPYQKLKGFYKRVLNLGPEYVRDAKTVEWITRGHVKEGGVDLGVVNSLLGEILADVTGESKGHLELMEGPFGSRLEGIVFVRVEMRDKDSQTNMLGH
nr:hypothetical protein [Tanacetum cinerariifolium]